MPLKTWTKLAPARTKRSGRLFQETDRTGFTWESVCAKHAPLLQEMRKIIAISALLGKESSLLLPITKYRKSSISQ